MIPFRIGHGSDLHRLVDGRPLYLGGVLIPSARGLLGHSDADVVLHAVCDAILGALGDGDIGEHFPDADPRQRNRRSTEMLADVVARMRRQRYAVVNVDVTITAEAPRLSPHRDAMRSAIAALVEVPPERVSIKAKTNEGLDAVGRGEAIAASAIVLLEGLAGD